MYKDTVIYLCSGTIINPYQGHHIKVYQCPIVLNVITFYCSLLLLGKISKVFFHKVKVAACLEFF